MGMSLYEIDTNIKAILDSMYDTVDENGEVKEVDLTALKQLQAERKVKLENIALYIKNIEAEAKAIKEEEKALKTRRERLEKKSERLQDLMIMSMKEAKDPEISTARFTARLKDNIVTNVLDESLIPDEYFTVHPATRTPNLNAIKAAIKAGTEVAGAENTIHTTINIK